VASLLVFQQMSAATLQPLAVQEAKQALGQVMEQLQKLAEPKLVPPPGETGPAVFTSKKEKDKHEDMEEPMVGGSSGAGDEDDELVELMGPAPEGCKHNRDDSQDYVRSCWSYTSMQGSACQQMLW